MKNMITAVIGLNYGDEGKGHVTSSLCGVSVDTRETVVRFNGGAQAAHHVEYNGHSHTFHSLGSGTFQGAGTFLGPKFLLDPVLLVEEIESMRQRHGLYDLNLRCDTEVQLVTMLDIMANQNDEAERGADRHGSCGMGIGRAQRRINRGLTLSLTDVLRGQWREKLDAIIEFYGVNPVEPGQRIWESAIMALPYLLTPSTYGLVSNDSDIIFEGAQGLMLDQNSDDFPHVTFSNTGLDNILELLNPDKDHLEIYFVTRPYATRHGAGPLKGEFKDFRYTDETNPENAFQGSLRFGPLDLLRMRRLVEKELQKASDFSHAWSLAITCCDQIPAYLGCDTQWKIDEIVDGVGVDKERVVTYWSPECSGFSKQFPFGVGSSRPVSDGVSC